MTPKEQKEQRAVEYLREQIDFGNPEVVLRVYKQVIDQNLFETETGLEFLSELQRFLLGSPDIDKSMIPRLPGQTADPKRAGHGKASGSSAAGGQASNDTSESSKEETDREALEQAATREAIRHEAMRIVKRERALSAEYQKKMYMAVVTAAVCFVMMIAMLVITLTSNLPTIINYREKITDQYASWEEDLNKREAELREKEKANGVLSPDKTDETDEESTDTENVDDGTEGE